jgi:flagellar hook assembly protein FlgD
VDGARIGCAIPAGLAGVRLRASIVDLAGRAVRALADRSAAPGVTTLEWDLRDNRGARVPAGVYFVLATAGGMSDTRRLVVTGGR